SRHESNRDRHGRRRTRVRTCNLALDTTCFFAALIVRANGSIQSGLAPVRAGGRHGFRRRDPSHYPQRNRRKVQYGKLEYVDRLSHNVEPYRPFVSELNRDSAMKMRIAIAMCTAVALMQALAPRSHAANAWLYEIDPRSGAFPTAVSAANVVVVGGLD